MQNVFGQNVKDKSIVIWLLIVLIVCKIDKEKK